VQGAENHYKDKVKPIGKEHFEKEAIRLVDFKLERAGFCYRCTREKIEHIATSDFRAGDSMVRAREKIVNI